MNLQQIRDYVRTSLDTDEEELPNSLVDVWITEGTQRIQYAPWLLTYFAKEWTLATVDGTPSYALTDIGDVAEITSVEGDRWLLKHRPHEAQVRKFAWSNLETEPTEYSISEGKLYLWGTPDTNYTLIIRGYRTPVAVAASGQEPDVPAVFHTAIAEWALARAYEQQDDDVMSAVKFQRADLEIDLLSRRYRRGPRGGIQQIAGVCEPVWPERLVYPWE